MVLANNNNSLPSALGQFLLMAKTGWKSRECCLAVLSPGLQAAVRLQRTRLTLLSGSSSPTTCRTRQCMACTIDELPKFPFFFPTSIAIAKAGHFVALAIDTWCHLISAVPCANPRKEFSPFKRFSSPRAPHGPAHDMHQVYHTTNGISSTSLPELPPASYVPCLSVRLHSYRLQTRGSVMGNGHKVR